MLIGMKFDASRTDWQQAFLIFTEVGNDLVGVICAFLLEIFEGSLMVFAIISCLLITSLCVP